MDVIYEVVGTPIGRFRIAERDGNVCAAAFGDRWQVVADRVEAGSGAIRWVEGTTRAAEAVRPYFEGEIEAIDGIEVAAAGTVFQAAVWSQLRRIRAGSTMSYSALADAIGAPGAARAAGTANGANPVCLIVPCHRVIRADGTAGGYGGGADRKEWLLEHESHNR
jgi:methylated-DNA-[protein]-cysteine S-methyltransferase